MRLYFVSILYTRWFSHGKSTLVRHDWIYLELMSAYWRNHWLASNNLTKSFAAFALFFVEFDSLESNDRCKCQAYMIELFPVVVDFQSLFHLSGQFWRGADRPSRLLLFRVLSQIINMIEYVILAKKWHLQTDGSHMARRKVDFIHSMKHRLIWFADGKLANKPKIPLKRKRLD